MLKGYVIPIASSDVREDVKSKTRLVLYYLYLNMFWKNKYIFIP